MAASGSENKKKESLTPIAAQWDKALDALPKKNDAELLTELNQKRIKIKRELFNQFVGLYQADLDAKMSLFWARGKKTDLAQDILRELDTPITSLTSARKLSDSFKKMEPDRQGNINAAFTTGRIAKPLEQAKSKVEQLDNDIEETSKKYENDIDKLLPDNFRDKLISLQHAVLYSDYTSRKLTEVERLQGEKPLEKEAINYLIQAAPFHLTKRTDHSTLEKELIASEKLSTIRNILLTEKPTGNTDSVSLQIAQRFLAVHSANHFRHTLLKSLMETQRKNEPDAAAWLINNIRWEGGKDGGRTLAYVLDHDFIPAFVKAAKTLPLDQKKLKDAIECLTNETLDWEKQLDNDRKESDGPKIQEKARAIANVKSKMNGLIQNTITCLEEDTKFLEKHNSTSDADLNDMMIAGEKAAAAIEHEKQASTSATLAEQKEWCSTKQQGYLAACLLDARKMAKQLVPQPKKDQKDEKHTESKVSLSHNPAATFHPAKDEDKDKATVVHLRDNIEQIISFYRARRGANSGDHADIANCFERELKKSHGLPVKRAQEYLQSKLEEFWQAEVKRYKNDEKTLIDTINKKEGHHMQRMVGMLLQDINPGRFTPPIVRYKRYHGDYHLELANPIPTLNNEKKLRR